MAEAFDKPTEETTAAQRHWLYGLNAGVLVAASLAVMIILAVLCKTEWVQRNTKFDWSSAGLNSLSGGTRKMLAYVDSKPEKEKYQLWSLFTDASDEIKRDNPTEAAKQNAQRQQIRDLLDQYKRASSRITWEDRGDSAADDIEKQIRDKFQGEFKPYQEAVDAYDPLVKKLSDFMKNEAAVIGAFAQKPGTPADEAQMAAVLQAQFAGIPAELEQGQRLIHREVDGNQLPNWGALKQKITETLDEIQPLIEFVGDADKLKAAVDGKKLPAALGAYFTEANARYKTMATELKGYKAQLDDLKPLKVQDVLDSLGRDTVVVMGENSAKVIPNKDLFTRSPNGRQGEEGVVFNGEQAISSAIYAMANPNKVKVVFVTAAPTHMLEDMYSDMKKELEDLNFEVLEWSPPASQQPGMPPEGGPPPASGKGVVWIVFPPETPSNPMMMMSAPDAGPVITATKTHLAKGGNVLFMAEPNGGFMGSATYPYADLVKDFGIQVDSKYTVMHMLEQPDSETGRVVSQNTVYVGFEPNRPVLYAKSEITTPVEGLQTIFGPVRLNNGGQAGACTVVKVINPAPAEVEAKELVTTPYDDSFWATTEPSATGKFDPTKDMKAPVPLMAVAVKDKGKKAPDGSSDEQRVGVLGAKMLGSDFFAQMMGIKSRPDGLRELSRQFPGNTELMKNTVLWLSGYENMIAVSAKANRPASIGAVTPGNWWTVFSLIVLAPVLALFVGILVWAARHR
jgi:hypothetical protein